MFIIKLRDQGIQCTNQVVMKEAAHTFTCISGEGNLHKEKITRQFTKSMGLTLCAAIYTAQEHFMETQPEVKGFIVMMKGRLSERKNHGIINIDQTPSVYSFHAKTVFEAKGTKQSGSYVDD